LRVQVVVYFQYEEDANSERYWKRCDFVDLYNLSRMSDGRASW